MSCDINTGSDIIRRRKVELLRFTLLKSRSCGRTSSSELDRPIGPIQISQPATWSFLCFLLSVDLFAHIFNRLCLRVGNGKSQPLALHQKGVAVPFVRG